MLRKGFGGSPMTTYHTMNSQMQGRRLAAASVAQRVAAALSWNQFRTKKMMASIDPALKRSYSNIGRYIGKFRDERGLIHHKIVIDICLYI